MLKTIQAANQENIIIFIIYTHRITVQVEQINYSKFMLNNTNT